ncbi:hypothetical protein E2C01_055016 [Portunus trituberculatus]|uniref:Uncharacterized protein n=1 Tax=Portunus trituberculatus TaxID=210409 RepID=A0A5B7GWH7_PORTR|nr:hypothetical protein [Portunus trituberculatus]
MAVTERGKVWGQLVEDIPSAGVEALQLPSGLSPIVKGLRSENSWSLSLLVVASGALEVSGDCHRDKPGSDYENETRAAGMSYIHIVLCPPGPRVAMDTEKGMLCIVALVVVFLRGSDGICIAISDRNVGEIANRNPGLHVTGCVPRGTTALWVAEHVFRSPLAARSSALSFPRDVGTPLTLLTLPITRVTLGHVMAWTPHVANYKSENS